MTTAWSMAIERRKPFTNSDVQGRDPNGRLTSTVRQCGNDASDFDHAVAHHI